MNIFEDTNPRALQYLLGEIHTRTSVLPDFQRDFVWEPGATQELINSIANNYPAGSILPDVAPRSSMAGHPTCDRRGRCDRS